MPRVARRVRRRRTEAAALATILAAGCIAVPVPTPRHGKSLITEETLATLEVGRTTRTDVLLTLGDPLERYGADRFFVYAWNETHGDVIVGVPGGGGVAPMEDTHRLVLDFGAAGQLARMATFDTGIAWNMRKTQSEADEKVRRWMDEEGVEP